MSKPHLTSPLKHLTPQASNMSTPQVSEQHQQRGANLHRGKRGSRGRGGGNRGRSTGPWQSGPPATITNANKSPSQVPQAQLEQAQVTKEDDQTETQVKQVNTQDADESAICFICAEPVKYYSVSQCNHRTCHVCALRLRALYKRMDCTYCKVSLFGL